MSDEEKKFLERPLAVVALVGGVVGVLGTGVAIYVSLAGLAAGQPTSADPTARVTDCIKAHGLEKASEGKDLGDGRWYFRACAWPAPTGANGDGFTEITVREEAGPGASEAEGMTDTHVFTTTCRDLEVHYLFDNQGTFVPEQPVVLTKGEVRRVEGGSVVANAMTPGRDQSIVLSNHRYQFDSVRCT